MSVFFSHGFEKLGWFAIFGDDGVEGAHAAAGIHHVFAGNSSSIAEEGFETLSSMIQETRPVVGEVNFTDVTKSSFKMIEEEFVGVDDEVEESILDGVFGFVNDDVVRSFRIPAFRGQLRKHLFLLSITGFLDP